MQIGSTQSLPGHYNHPEKLERLPDLYSLLLSRRQLRTTWARHEKHIPIQACYSTYLLSFMHMIWQHAALQSGLFLTQHICQQILQFYSKKYRIVTAENSDDTCTVNEKIA